ncbi:MAG TPA: hypothetical protein VEG34_08565 [Thermoanaerobaculia bacterium]|nr:hypothetical protein [Thermoanaerobaculia bacterium]
MSPKSTLRLLTATLTLAAVLTLASAAAFGQPADDTATKTDSTEPSSQGSGTGGDNWHGAGIDPNG